MNTIRDPSSRVLRRIVTHFYSGVNSILFLLGIGDPTRERPVQNVISGARSRGGIEAAGISARVRAALEK